MSDNIVISQHPEIVTTDIREIDQKPLIQLAISYGLQPISVVGNRSGVWTHFESTTFNPFEQQYMGERKIPLSIRMISHSTDWWRNLMVVWKSQKRYQAVLQVGKYIPDSNRFGVWENTEKKFETGIPTRDIDREDLFKQIYASGIDPLFVEGDNRNTIWVHFEPSELKVFEDKYFSNIDMTFSLGRFIRASEVWADYMLMYSSKLKTRKNGW